MDHGIPYRSELIHAIEENLSWVKKSIEAQSGQGSSAYRMWWGTWGQSYPETTGYLIPTLLHADGLIDHIDYASTANHLTRFLISIQNEDGSFPIQLNSSQVNVFDTAQILLGLCSYYQYQKDDELKQAIVLCHNWLVAQLDENGKFLEHNLYKDYNPSYYLRIIWPILWSARILNLQIPSSVIQSYEYLTQLISETEVRDASFPSKRHYLYAYSYVCHKRFN